MIGGMKARRAYEMREHVTKIIRRWPEFANKAGVAEDRIRKIQNSHRLDLPDWGKSIIKING